MLLRHARLPFRHSPDNVNGTCLKIRPLPSRRHGDGALLRGMPTQLAPSRHVILNGAQRSEESQTVIAYLMMRFLASLGMTSGVPAMVVTRFVVTLGMTFGLPVMANTTCSLVWVYS